MGNLKEQGMLLCVSSFEHVRCYSPPPTTTISLFAYSLIFLLFYILILSKNFDKT